MYGRRFGPIHDRDPEHVVQRHFDFVLFRLYHEKEVVRSKPLDLFEFEFEGHLLHYIKNGLVFFSKFSENQCHLYQRLAPGF